jgi:Flp pilus assembly pilin Flp
MNDMRTALHQIWTEEDGVLAFEWTLLITLLTIGIVTGVAAARDAIIDELGDVAQTMLAVDQSYHIGFPLAAAVHAPNTSSSSDSDFIDALAYTDCERDPGFIGQDPSIVDDSFPDGG